MAARGTVPWPNAMSHHRGAPEWLHYFSGAGQAGNVFTAIEPIVVPEYGIHQAHVQCTKGLHVPFAEPAVVFFHAFHALRETYPDQFINVSVCLTVKIVFHLRGRSIEDGLVLLNKYICPGQGT